jgi:transcription elongation factor GreA
MRSLGLLVDGPAAWGKPVSSRRPGVFVVELPGGAERAPIDIVAVRRWVDQVPGMIVDGVAAAAPDVARRLEQFWLPFEPILYVGRSRAIGQRVAQMYATPLGDARPYSGGHWLKTLSALSNLRVWWAATDAVEEYEDALLSAIAARTSPEVTAALPDPNVVVPFANMLVPGSVWKPHGFQNSLREVDSTVGAHAASAKKPKAPRAPSAPRAPRLKTPTRPAPEPTYLSEEGLSRMTAELDELRATVRPQVIARVKAARELGDLKENADYEYARKEQSFVEGRIQSLEAMIRTGVVIDASSKSDTARLGSTLVIESNGEEMTFVLVGSAEADPAAGRISDVSPVGRALLGARAGDEVTAQLPNGTVTYQVRAVR